MQLRHRSLKRYDDKDEAQIMSSGLSNKLAGQVGEFLVCAELGRRGFIATSFAGNVPEFDLIVANDTLRTIPI
jgi:hypothetical protein